MGKGILITVLSGLVLGGLLAAYSTKSKKSKKVRTAQ
jgi:hypothetical protein